MADRTITEKADFSILDPLGVRPETEIIPLESLRPDTLKNKTVYVYTSEAVPLLMPEIAKLLSERFPDTKVILWDNSVGGRDGDAVFRGELVDEIKEKADAAIVGHCE